MRWSVDIKYGDIKVLDEILEERKRKNRLWRGLQFWLEGRRGSD
jgi:hypothetical protein